MQNLVPVTWGWIVCTVKLGNKELFDKEQIGIKEPFPVTNLPFTKYEYGTFGINEQF